MRHSAATLRKAVLAAVVAAAATVSASAQPSVSVDTEWVFDATAAQPGSTIRAALGVRIQETWHVHSNKPLEEGLIPTVLKVNAPEGFAVTRVVYPEPVMLTLSFSPDPLSVFENEFVIGVELAVGEEVAPGTYSIKGELHYQACDDKTCVAPDSRSLEYALNVVADADSVERVESPLFDEIASWEGGEVPSDAPQDGPPVAVTFDEDCDVLAVLEDFDILATTGGYLGADEFLAFIDAAETGVKQKGMFEGKGILAVVVLIIVGGVLLNLTPCVLPLIPINLAIIGAGAQSGSRLRGFALGGTYGISMALVYGVLGLLVVLAADKFSFGQINSTIWFNVAIAILFVFLALAMFDVIAIDFTKYQGKLDVTSRARQGTFVLAFFMGSVTALLAGACVAPVVIQVIVYSADLNAKGHKIALALPFLLGVGLALPWPILGAGISVLPKPGMWMVRVKQALGVFILVFAGYYGYLAWEIFDNTRGVTEADVAAAAELEEGWTASICEGLARAGVENKPLFVDMWATWCKNCLAMDKTTFKDPAVVARLEGYVKVKFQAENLKASPAKELLEQFDGIGLPTYAILRPKNAAGGIR
ncbi:MAG: thioredoxin family protein [Phycisphaerales bacterium]|nr:MAG: thioredoxin family protein [Phycisphaerales bacterium]